jgi:hypothetical protein
MLATRKKLALNEIFSVCSGWTDNYMLWPRGLSTHEEELIFSLFTDFTSLAQGSVDF